MKNLELSDKLNKKYIRFIYSKEKNVWEKWVSENKTDWKLIKEKNTFLDIIDETENVTNNNFMFLWNLLNQKSPE